MNFQMTKADSLKKLRPLRGTRYVRRARWGWAGGNASSRPARGYTARGPVVCALLLLLAGCAGPGASANLAAGNSALQVYLYQEPTGVFSPLAPASGPDTQVLSFIEEGLLAVGPDYRIRPRIARDYRVSPDARTFTFHLRPEARWSDGRALTSADLVFTYRLLGDKRSTSANASNYADITALSAPDAHTFVIRTGKPDAGLLARIGTSPILPEHVLGKIPVEKVAKAPYFRSPTVTNGPFRFVDYRSNQFVHVTANRFYYRKAGIRDIYLKMMKSDVAAAQLRSGGLDIASLSPTDLDVASGFPSVRIASGLGSGFVRIALNQSRPYFRDVRVRKAFLYAVDRRKIVRNVLLGNAEVQNSDFFNRSAPRDLDPYAYDPAKARALLAKAGWDPNRTLTLQLVPGQRDRDLTAMVVAEQLGKVGVRVRIDQVQAAQLPPSYTDRSYDLTLYGGGNYAADPNSVAVISGCGQFYPDGGNIDFFCDRELDRLMDRANALADPRARAATYAEAARRSNAMADLMWLYAPRGLWGVNNRVHGFQAPGSQDTPAFWDPASWRLTR
ncbi:ABC transporter substrate-binding protein [Sciscionella sediminilitoris]|uniref:ABC transporter substrate-binding protein n=1 Tax=Sciscionella sediminilitoris TaxID=1445613 RepID=UPI0009E9ACFB|nr:ABC transporter substrate-binding protein [Sciscionella sp. SE31]